MGKRRIALYHAFHTSLPIMAGYGFLGLTYGIYMHELGFNFLYPMLLAITVYAGSAEFLLGNIRNFTLLFSTTRCKNQT